MSTHQDGKVVTRFAPSPTGSLHLGNARTAFFSFLWARKAGGRFILRIEDTDAERSQQRYYEGLLTDLRWLGLDWDEGPDIGGPSAPYSQAERGEFYGALFEQLLRTERAYPCYCSADELELSRKLQRMAGKPPRYAGTCRHLSGAERGEREARGLKPSLRFAVPAGRVVQFTDSVHGPQRFVSDDIGDFIIRREDGTSAFFFCNAVDDSVMRVTHVLRGDDHLTNTPRQIMILEALDMRVPGYGHVGLLVGADGAPLSKRHGSTSVQEFRDRGFLREAMLNQLFHLGHTSDIDGWLPLNDMPAHYRPDHLGRAPARFDDTQLIHWQKETLARLPTAEVTAWLGAADSSEFVELVRHNVVLPGEAVAWRNVVQGTLPPFSAADQAIIVAAGADFFGAALDNVQQVNGDFKLFAKLLKDRTGRKGADLFMPLRLALTGQTHGPELAPLFKLMTLETARQRLQAAQNLC